MIPHSAEKHITCTIVGDGMVGKTQICHTLAQTKMSEDYTATVKEDYTVSTERMGEKYVVRIVDSSGQHDYKDIRTKSYKESDVFIACYSVVDRNSFENIHSYWVPEIRHICKKTPIILVATGKDIRKRNDVSTEEGLSLMEKLEIDTYVECVSNSKDDVTEIFEDVLLAFLKQKRKRRRSSILHTLHIL